MTLLAIVFAIIAFLIMVLFAFVRIGAHIFIMLTYVMQSRLFEAIGARTGSIWTMHSSLTTHSSHSFIGRYSDSNGVRNCALGTGDLGK